MDKLFKSFMHFVVELAGTKMKIDINFKYKKGIHADYSKIDGSRMVVLSLSPEELLNEKITAYNDKILVRFDGFTLLPPKYNLRSLYVKTG